MQEYELSAKVLAKTEKSVKADLLTAYNLLAMGDHAGSKALLDRLQPQELSAADTALVAQLNNYFKELAGEKVFETVFSASLQNKTIVFQKDMNQKVKIQFYQLNPFNYLDSADFSDIAPTFEFETQEMLFQIPNLQGLF